MSTPNDGRPEADVSEFCLLWTTRLDANMAYRQSTNNGKQPTALPEYLEDEILGRAVDRNGKGCVRASSSLGLKFPDVELSNKPFAPRAAERCGLVVRRSDIDFVRAMPGVLTDWNLDGVA